MDDDVKKALTKLSRRVSTLETRAGIDPATPATPVTPATPPAATGPTGASGATGDGPVVLPAPTATPSSAGYALSAEVRATQEVRFTYLQIAVRGPGAKDTGFAPNVSLAAGGTLKLSGSLYTDKAGDYTAYVAYSLDGTSWFNGPSTTFRIASTSSSASDGATGSTPITSASGGLKVKRVNRSGLGHNQLVFRTTPQDADRWGKSMGFDVDGFLYFVARGSWDQLRSLWGSGHKDWLESGRIITVTLPVAPESEGDQMNMRGAHNDYRQQQRELGKWFADNGFNCGNAAFRVGWEMNGNWYKWSCNRPGGVDAYRQSIRNFVDNMRAGGLGDATFTQCWNKGPGQTSNGLEAFAGSQWIDVVGIDQYDMWGPARNDQQWQGELNKNPSAKAVAELAAREGIQWSWDEGGNTHGDGSAYGGDNDYYWVGVDGTLRKYGETCAWHNAYDERGAPATLRHDFDSNPNAKKKFQQLWKAA